MTQGELEQIPQPFVELMSELEMRIMKDIVEKIKANGFSSASVDWEISRLRQLGESEEQIRKWIAEALDKTDDELDKVFSDDVYEEYYGHARAYQVSGFEQIPFEQNIQLQQLIEAAKFQTKDTFRNLTASTGFAIRNPATGNIIYSPTMEFYQKTLDAAIMDIKSGAFSYNTVLQRTINTMTTSGLRWIDYDSGWHNRVDVAARRSVMTGFRQVQGKINEQVAEQLQTDSYEVTYHVGARPTHQPWQGRVWTMQQLQEVCGLGTVTGLCGINCYHAYRPFIPGVSVRTYTDEQLDKMIAEENTPKEYLGKKYTTYEALQAQRRMETRMRKTRQDIRLMQNGEADPNDITLKKAKYQGQMQTYKDFSEAMDLPEQMERVYQDGLRGKFTPTKTELARVEKPVAKAKESDIMESDLGVFKQKLRSDENVGREYYDMLKEKFSHGRDDAKRVFAKYAGGKTVENSSYEGTAHFDTTTKKISMHYGADLRNDRGAGATWFHEHGHLIDNVLGVISDDKQFRALLEKEPVKYRIAYGEKYNLKTYDKVDKAISDELQDMRKHSAVSDLLGGLTHGNIIGCAGHETGYWGNPKSTTSEAFAHMFEAQFDEVRYAEMKKYFPESLAYFEKKLKELAK